MADQDGEGIVTRDMDLIRQLMLKLEALPLRPGAVAMLDGHDPDAAVEGYSDDQITYHLELLKKAGFVESVSSQPMRGITFKGFTWAGHDFLDSVRDPKVWSEAKDKVKKAGGFTVDILVGVAKEIIKHKLSQLGWTA
jgi:hypothetical protein